MPTKKDRAAARAKRRRELEDEFDDLERQFEELRLKPPGSFVDPEIELVAAMVRRRLLNLEESRTEYIERGLAKWEDEQPIRVTGKYRDNKKRRRIYQQKFFDLYRRLKPGIIADLRELTELFLLVFRENQTAYYRLFEWSHDFDIWNADNDFKTEVLTQLSQILKPQNIYKFLDFRPFDSNQYRYDYKWGEYRALLEVVTLLINDEPNRLDYLDAPIEHIASGIVLKFVDVQPAHETELAEMKRQIASLVVKKLVISDAKPNFVEKTRNVVMKYFETTLKISDPQWKGFIQLKLNLLKWAERYGLEKDWILRYAYHLLSVLSEKPGVSPADLEIPALQERELFTDRFEFKFEAWLPGDESREEYESRLCGKFELALHNFFQYEGRRLKLDRLAPDRKKWITRPIDPDFESIRWLIAWNEGATYPQIKNCFGRGRRTIIDGIDLLEEHDLPRRPARPGRKKAIRISDEQIHEIKYCN